MYLLMILPIAGAWEPGAGDTLVAVDLEMAI